MKNESDNHEGVINCTDGNSPNAGVGQPVGADCARGAKVDQDVRIARSHDVGRLDVAMNDALAVDVTAATWSVIWWHVYLRV